MYQVKIVRDVYGEQRVRFYRDIELPFPPIVGMWVLADERHFAARLDEVRWDVDEARFYCEMKAYVAETDDEAKQMRQEFVELFGWKLYGINAY